MIKLIFTVIVMSASGFGASAQEKFGDTFGDGVAAYTLQYYEEARRIWTPLAENGDGAAAFRLADLFERGLGGTIDMQKAASLMKQAAESGHDAAVRKYADMLAAGRGVEGDEDESLRLVRMAGEKGESWAAWQMGSRYLKGDGVEKDKAAALAWFRCASKGEGTDAEKSRAASTADRLEAVLLPRTIAASKSVKAC